MIKSSLATLEFNKNHFIYQRFVFSCYLDSARCVTLKAEFETMDGKNQDVDSETFKETYCDDRGSLFHT